MNEEWWLACTNPYLMLAFLQREIVILVDQEPPERQEMMRRHLLSIVNPRKVYLFGCACCRRVWSLLKDERSRHAVEVTEQYIDGLADFNEWLTAMNESLMARDAIQTTPRDAD